MCSLLFAMIMVSIQSMIQYIECYCTMLVNFTVFTDSVHTCHVYFLFITISLFSDQC